MQVPVALGTYQYPGMAYQYGKREAHAPSHPHAYLASSSQQETTEFLQDWFMMRSPHPSTFLLTKQTTP